MFNPSRINPFDENILFKSVRGSVCMCYENQPMMNTMFGLHLRNSLDEPRAAGENFVIKDVAIKPARWEWDRLVSFIAIITRLFDLGYPVWGDSLQMTTKMKRASGTVLFNEILVGT